MNILHSIGKIYAHFLKSKNDENYQKRYVGREHFYHASGAGMCSRKLYFQSVEKVEPTNLPNTASVRRMRLGTLVHEDIQKSLLSYNSIYNNITNNTNDINITENIGTSLQAVHNPSSVYDIEGEIIIEELTVRGFYDFVQDDGDGVVLYDIKTAADYPFKKTFNTKEPYTMKHHELQLSTYGYGVKEKYGRLVGMYLLYYNKNTSVLKYKQVPLSMVGTAYMFWANIKKQHSTGLPNFEDGISPVMKWECDYCGYFEHCNPPAPYGRYSHKNTLKKGDIINE